MPELVLYGIRLLGKQLLGTFLDMEVDQSGLTWSVKTRRTLLSLSLMQVATTGSPTGSGLMAAERSRGLSG